MIIFAVSSLELPVRPTVFPYDDKLIHMVEYGIFSWLWFRAVLLHTGLSLKYIGLLAVSLTMLFGALDEWYQSINPTRTSAVQDFLADVLGGVIVVTLLIALHHFRNSNENRVRNSGL